MRYLFSVIVPVYNVMDYLTECLESLLKQDCDSYEIVIVDDGSNDGSEYIVDNYSLYSNITVIHQKNQGLSAARNTGIENAKGEYIIFVDSDDYISPDTLSEVEKIILQNSNPDIVAIKAYKLKADGAIEPKIANERILNNVSSGETFFSWHCKNKTFTACAPMYICKSNIINGYKLRFKSGLLHEDELWTPILLYHAETVVDTSLIKYFHRERANSITHNNNKKTKNVRDLIIIANDLLSFAFANNRFNVTWLRDRVAMLYMNAVFIGEEENVKHTDINRLLPIKNAYSLRNRLKAMIFLVSPILYIKIDKCIKK